MSEALQVNQAQTGPRAALAKIQIGLALAGAGLGVAAEAVFANEASANEGLPAPTAQTAPTVSTQLTEFNVTSASSEASAVASDSAISRVVLAFRNANGIPRSELKGMKDKCYIDKNGFWNSGTILGESPNKPAFFWDKRPTIICANPKSPTGFVKAGLPKNMHVLDDGYQTHDAKPGTICNNEVQGHKPKRTVVNPIVVRSFKDTINVKAHAEAIADAYCAPGVSAHASAGADASAKLSIKEVVKTRGSALTQIKETAKAKAAASASAKASCESVNGTTTPHTPNISIEKDLIGSYNPDGSLYSLTTTKHGNIDRWDIEVTNTGDEALKTDFTDVPPQGLNVITGQPNEPFGLKVNGEGVGAWSGQSLLEVGETEQYEIDTINFAAACFQNLINKVTVLGHDAFGKTVSDWAIAYIKEQNTGPDCIGTPPPTNGPGQ